SDFSKEILYYFEKFNGINNSSTYVQKLCSSAPESCDPFTLLNHDDIGLELPEKNILPSNNGNIFSNDKVNRLVQIVIDIYGLEEISYKDLGKLDLMNRGAFGDVYRTFYKLTSNVVAVKKISIIPDDEYDGIKMLFNEICILSLGITP
ncbi:15611_t:CDS:2, partial [Gigaspora margarita]